MTKRSRDDQWARQLHLQWQNKALTNTELTWCQYVDDFLRDYDNLNADNPKDIQNFLNKYFTFKENREDGVRQLLYDPYAQEGTYVLAAYSIVL